MLFCFFYKFVLFVKAYRQIGAEDGSNDLCMSVGIIVTVFEKRSSRVHQHILRNIILLIYYLIITVPSISELFMLLSLSMYV
jgi:hypothetical protein